MNSKQPTKKRKSKILKRILLVVILLFLAIGGYTGFLLYKTFKVANESYTELDRGEKSKLREVIIEAEQDPISVLIMGIEDWSTGGKNGRTDSLLLATLNPENKTMKLLSIPRDTKVFIESENKEDKINHAYVFGGKEGTVEAVETLLQIPIDYYATVNFKAFKDIIDEIGGITVNVPFDFWERSDVDNSKIYFTKGEMTLDGEEALAYARMRKRDPRGDFGRNDRQQQIISLVIDKLMSPNNLFKLNAIADHIGTNVETNMAVREALGLQKTYTNFSSHNIEKLSIEGVDSYENGVYYFVPKEESIEKMKQELKLHLKISEDSEKNTSNEENSA